MPPAFKPWETGSASTSRASPLRTPDEAHGFSERVEAPEKSGKPARRNLLPAAHSDNNINPGAQAGARGQAASDLNAETLECRIESCNARRGAASFLASAFARVKESS